MKKFLEEIFSLIYCVPVNIKNKFKIVCYLVYVYLLLSHLNIQFQLDH